MSGHGIVLVAAHLYTDGDDDDDAGDDDGDDDDGDDYDGYDDYDFIFSSGGLLLSSLPAWATRVL